MKSSSAVSSSSIMTSHQEAIDQALRQALATSQPALRRQALDRVARHLIHPRLILDSPLLGHDHSWRREALIVSDAFEAVTNGMEEPGVLEALESLEADSPFRPWYHLILAIHFFYDGLDEAVLAHVAAIPASSPTAVLGQTLQHLIRPGSVATLSTTQRQLVELLTRPDPRALQAVQDVAEGLENDQEALFWEAFADWLENVASSAPDQARAAVLWVWNQLEWREFDEKVLLDLGSNLWGAAESYRLAALGTHEWDPEGAALLWLRFLLTSIREESLARPQLAEARALLHRFREAALKTGTPSPEGEETWNQLVRAWNLETGVRRWADLEIDGSTAPSPAPQPRPSFTGQLDLFS